MITRAAPRCRLVFVRGGTMNEYKTVKKSSFDEFTEKRSRFIGYIKPVRTEEEATAFINELRSKHWNATHNVYAYSLREGNITRYSDDGEPSGTAGMPVLDVLLKNGITDVCFAASARRAVHITDTERSPR